MHLACSRSLAHSGKPWPAVVISDVHATRALCVQVPGLEVSTLAVGLFTGVRSLDQVGKLANFTALLIIAFCLAVLILIRHGPVISSGHLVSR